MALKRGLTVAEHVRAPDTHPVFVALLKAIGGNTAHLADLVETKHSNISALKSGSRHISLDRLHQFIQIVYIKTGVRMSIWFNADGDISHNITLKTTTAEYEDVDE